MAYECVGAGFSVRVEGSLSGTWGEWHVRARVSYRAQTDTASLHRAWTDARSALFTGLFREARVGRARGARIVRVRIDGDPVVEGSFTMRSPVPHAARAA
jgi:hypothetical protein